MLSPYFIVFLMFPSLILASFCPTTTTKLGKEIRVLKCCKGYYSQITNGTLSCTPICKVACGMGVCIMPNTCNCTEGYVHSDGVTTNSCKPHCTKGCPNGQCSAPEFCDCNPGYKWNKDSKQCDPFCNSGCPNARCESPGKCICNEGYKQIEAQTDAGETQTDAESEPICELECAMNRTCTAPGTCGYIKGFGFIDFGEKSINEFINCWLFELLVGGLLLVILIGCCIFFISHQQFTNHAARQEKKYNNKITPETSPILAIH